MAIYTTAIIPLLLMVLEIVTTFPNDNVNMAPDMGILLQGEHQKFESFLGRAL